MPNRRILSLWVPRLGAERVMRAERGMLEGPLAIVAEQANAQVITSLNGAASAVGLQVALTGIRKSQAGMFQDQICERQFGCERSVWAVSNRKNR